MPTRIIEFDILKGILIIFVIIGHSVPIDSNTHQIIFSFHMPVFFMITGYLTSDWSFNRNSIKKEIKKLLVPYFCYCVIFYILFHPEPIYRNIVRIFLGGRFHNNFYSIPYWFINTLFVVKIIFRYLLSNKARKYIPFIVLICWGICHSLSIWRIPTLRLPWGIDCALGAICFLYIGYIIRQQFKINELEQLLSKHFVLVGQLVFFVLYFIFRGQYTLNMMDIYYTNIVFDFIIPCAFFILLLKLSYTIKNIRILDTTMSYIGQSSMVIFFIHNTIIHFFKVSGIQLLYALIPIILTSTLVSKLSNRHKITRRLFLGTE